MLSKTLRFLALASVVCSCSTSRNIELDNELAQESHVTSREKLKVETKRAVDQDQDISAEQKQQLNELRNLTSKQIDDYNRQSLQLRSVLVKSLLSPNYSPEKINLIKKRMRKLEDQRLTSLFYATEKANLILGRLATRYPHVMREYMENRFLE